MRTGLSKLELVAARTVDAALVALRSDPSLLPIAGGTDIYVGLNFGTLQTRRFLDVWALDDLKQIRLRDDVLSIGALAPYTSIIRSELVQERMGMLVSAARETGGIQIQNRGTLGGNIANASPAADSLPVLFAADAVVVLKSVDGERRIPITGFYTGYRATVKRADELITAIEVSPVDGRQWFFKVGTRAAQAISKIVMAAVRSPRPRLALGSVAPTPIRLPNTEAALAGGASPAEARRVLESEISPIDDVRSTADYRRHVAGNLLERFWRETALP
jgi:xanthine dehydrogenase small subunit